MTDINAIFAFRKIYEWVQPFLTVVLVGLTIHLVLVISAETQETVIQDINLQGNVMVGPSTQPAQVATAEPDDVYRVEDDYILKIPLVEAGLTITPTLQWHTFLGSAGGEGSQDMAIDGNGNIYITGDGYGSWGTPLSPYVGGGDVFVAKLNSNGVLQWNTFLGSASDDAGIGITTDRSGNVYVSGYSAATWGTPINPHAGTRTYDIFAAKLNSNGVLQWNTFMGSTGVDYNSGVAVDEDGYIYLTGYSNAPWGTPLNPHTGGNQFNIVGAKLNSDDGALQWHTFLGASNDRGHDIALDSTGDIYITGYSDTTWGTPLNPHTGGSDAIVIKLNDNGAVQWHTFMGSSQSEQGWGIAIDGSDNIYITGLSTATWGTPLNPYTGGADVFVIKLNDSGAIQWHTFLGSANYDIGSDVVVDERGNVDVIGSSSAAWGTPVNPYAGGSDTFVTKLNDSGAIQWHTFLGSLTYDSGRGVAVDGNSYMYLTGYSDATWGTPLNPHAGGGEIFLTRIAEGVDLGIRKTVFPLTALPGQPITYTLTFSNASSITATDVIITDLIPISVTNTSIISSGVVITQTSPDYTWSVQDLNQIQGGIITITAILSDFLETHHFSNTVTITSTTIDVDVSNNRSEVGLTVVLPPNLVITKTVTTANNPVQRGGPITYTIIVANRGGINAMGVRITDTLPNYVNGVALDETKTVTAGDRVTLTINATLDAAAPFGEMITNTAFFSHTSGRGQDSDFFSVEEPVRAFLPVILKTSHASISPRRYATPQG